MEFRELLYSKDRQIGDCDEFIEHIKNCFLNYEFVGSNSYILIDLLYKKRRILKNLNYDNVQKTLQKLKKIDEEIYIQVEILKQEIISDFKSGGDEEKYSKSQKEILGKFLGDIIHTKSLEIKKEIFLGVFESLRNNQWLWTILFFAFGLGIFLLYSFICYGRMPLISQGELVYVSIVTSTIFLLMPFAIFVYIALLAIFYNDIKKSNSKFKFVVYIFFAVFVLSVLAVVAMNTGNFNKNLFIPLILASSIFFWIFFIKDEITKNDCLGLLIIGFTGVSFGLVCVFSSSVYKRLDFGDLDYKYIVLDSNASLPDEICGGDFSKFSKDMKSVVSYKYENLIYKNDDNEIKSLNIPRNCIYLIDGESKKIVKNQHYDSKIDKNINLSISPTHFIKNSKDIRLYNIKVLSKLGGIWEIEAKDGFKFGLDKKFIKTEILE